MGSAPIYITAASGAYLSATATWDSSGLSSGSSITVYIDVSSSGGWRLKKDSTIYFERQGNLSSSFTGNVDYTYQFQLWDTVEQKYQLQNFTVTLDSSGGGSGGDSGGGEEAEIYTITYYNANGQLHATQNEYEGNSFTLDASHPSKPNTFSDSHYTIVGDANGGSFSNGITTTSIEATKTTTVKYTFSHWNDNILGTGTNYYTDSSYTMPSYDFDLYPCYTSSSSVSYSNNTLSQLATPDPPPETSTTTLTVIFDANGGTVSMTNQSVTAIITKIFDGWMETSTGTTTITTLKTAGTVYAKWIDSPPNGSIILPLPTRSGYNFDGWSTSLTGSNLQQAGSSVAISENTTFYAIWTEKEKPRGGIFIHDGIMWQLVSS